MRNLFLFFMLNVALGQTDTLICDDTKIFASLFEELNLSDRKNYFEVDLDYLPSGFTLKYLDDLIVIPQTEKQRLLKVIKEGKEPICERVNQSISKMGKGKEYSKDGSYIKFSFSWPIAISDRVKYVFLISSIKNIHHRGNKVIGKEMLYIFEKEKNDEWVLKAKRAIAEY